MSYREVVAGVSREEALAETCPTCEAKPGDPCTYEHDLFTYSRGPNGRTKHLAHRRGEELPGVHNARAGIVKARNLAAWRATEPVHGYRPKAGRVTDAEMAEMYEAGCTLSEAARASGLSMFTVRRRLREAGVVTRRPGPSPAAAAETAARDVRIARLYRGGAEVTAIAGMEDVTSVTVRNALARQDVKLRDTS